MSMFDLADTDFMKDSIAETEDFTGETIVVYTLSSSTATLSSLEPASVVYGSTQETANVRRISAREVNESGGIYMADDLVVNSSGSYSQNARIGYRSGTYEVIEKPAPTPIGEIDLRWKAVIRRG